MEGNVLSLARILVYRSDLITPGLTAPFLVLTFLVVLGVKGFSAENCIDARFWLEVRG